MSKLEGVDVEHLSKEKVTHTTGPTIWTDAIYDYMAMQVRDPQVACSHAFGT